MAISRRSVICGGVLALAVATTAWSAETPRPPHQRPADITTDEAGLWYAADKAEQGIKASGDLDADAALTAYVKGVECKVAPEYCDEVRLYVMDRPFFNAMAAPNGAIEVWSGALLRVRNEAGLAFVLGHETTHYAFNHSLLEQRELKGRMDAIVPLGVLFAPFVGPLVLDLGYLGAVAGFEHYSRDREMEADHGGADRMTAAGYDPAAAAGDWKLLIDEQDHSEFDKIRKQHARAGLFDDHPLEGDRLEALTALAKDRTGDLGQQRFRAALRPHLAEFLRQDVRRRDYGETLFVIDQLAADGGDAGVLGFYRGECLRLRGGDGDAAKAIEAYVSALDAPDAPPDAWRDLGELYERGHQAEKARAAYQAYLDHAPAAQDRWMVQAALQKLDPTEAK